MEELKELELSLQSPDLSGPFGRPVEDTNELKDEIIESLGKPMNYEHINEEIETPSDNVKVEITTDEISARKAFLYFNDKQEAKEGKHSFEHKVHTILEELKNLKSMVDHRAENQEENKQKDSNNVLQEIEVLQNQVERILNPLEQNEFLLGDTSIKPLTETLSKLTAEAEAKSTDPSDVVYELMFNKDCK